LSGFVGEDHTGVIGRFRPTLLGHLIATVAATPEN
jgi:hypothetical protein